MHDVDQKWGKNSKILPIFAKNYQLFQSQKFFLYEWEKFHANNITKMYQTLSIFERRVQCCMSKVAISVRNSIKRDFLAMADSHRC